MEYYAMFKRSRLIFTHWYETIGKIHSIPSFVLKKNSCVYAYKCIEKNPRRLCSKLITVGKFWEVHQLRDKGERVSFFFFLLNLWGRGDINKILQILSVQLHNTSSVYCIVLTTPSQASSRHHGFNPFCPLLLPLKLPFPSGNHHAVV